MNFLLSHLNDDCYESEFFKHVGIDHMSTQYVDCVKFGISSHLVIMLGNNKYNQTDVI